MQSENLAHRSAFSSLSDALKLESPKMIALVGAGGKTTAMRRLAKELTAKNNKILVTTTTHVFLEQVSDLGEVIISGDLDYIKKNVTQKLILQTNKLLAHVVTILANEACQTYCKPIVVVSYTKLSYAPVGFEADVPYTLALAEFDGFKVFGRLSKEIMDSERSVGMAVRIRIINLPGEKLCYEFARG